MSFFSRIMADIRTVIAAVLGIFGIFLLVCAGVANGPQEMAKTGDVNANLWAGLALVVLSALMALWRFASPGETGDSSSSGSSSTNSPAEDHR